MLPTSTEHPAGLVPLTPELLRSIPTKEVPPWDEHEPPDGSTLRTSSYTVYVDLPQDSEHMLLVHGYTGAHLKVSRRVATYVRSLDARPPRTLYGDWRPAPAVGGAHEHASDDTIALLKRRRFLVTMSPEQEETWFTGLVHRVQDKLLDAPPSYTVLLTYQCNLRCVYCFQQGVRAEPGGSDHQPMALDTVDRLARGLLAIEAAHGVQPRADSPRRIRFFGGEPLLACNRPAVERWVERMAARGGAIFSATTNGTELHHYRDLLGEGGISHVEITLDGPAHVHDRRRLRIHGEGSFGRVAENITLALDAGATVQLRVNVDRSNVDSLSALCEELEARGWVESTNFLPTQLCAVHASTPSVDPRSIFDGWQLSKVARELRLGRGVRVPLKTQDTDMKTRVRQVLERRARPSSVMASSFCVAHTTEYMLDPAADIYVCAERTGDPGLRVGHVTRDGEVLVDPVNLRKWRNRTVATNPVCRRCRYAMFCGGGCAAQAENRRGGFYKGYCDGFDRRFRATVAEAYLEHARRRAEPITATPARAHAEPGASRPS